MNEQRLKTEYERNGYVRSINVLSPREAQRHHEHLVAYEASHGSLHYAVKPYLVFSSAWEIATHPRLLDAVEAVLGADILLWDSAFIIKEPQSEHFVSWHQDLTYWGLEMDSDDDLVSAWIAITPARRENGCMQFVKSSHRGEKFHHEDSKISIKLQSSRTGYQFGIGKVSLHRCASFLSGCQPFL